MCTVLPFGLATAPFVFSKVMKVVVNYCRAQGVRVLTFLDDGIGSGQTAEVTQKHAEMVRSTLDQAGMTVHPIKSAWEPKQRTEAFLGYRIDLHAGTIGIKVERVMKLIGALAELRVDEHPTRRQVSSIAGRIMSMQQVLGNLVRILTRELYALMYSVEGSWETRLSWTAAAWEEVRFWRRLAVEGGLEKQVAFWPNPVAIDLEFASDASDVAMGVVQLADGAVINKTFAPLTGGDSERSSTWRELAAIRLGLMSFLPDLRGRVVRWRTDNQAAALILMNGSRVPELQVLARDMFLQCQQAAIRLAPLWVPRSENSEADTMSRQTDLNDWG